MEAKSSKPTIFKQANLECKNLQDYLKSKPSNIIESLYAHPSICLAVYRYCSCDYYPFSVRLNNLIHLNVSLLIRELPEIARQFVIRILFVDQPVPQAVISSWTSQLYLKSVDLLYENTSADESSSTVFILSFSH